MDTNTPKHMRPIHLTPTGRATGEVLRLNRPGVVNMRRALFAVGLHPPVDEGG